MNALHARSEHLAGCAWFWFWALVGFGLALGAISLGPLLLLPLGLIALALASSERIRRSAFGLLTGAGGLFLFVAWLQQGGNSLDARPWLAIGVALAVAGIVGHARRV
jgi:hypothetical protein